MTSLSDRAPDTPPRTDAPALSSPLAQALMERILARTAKVGVIGLGYVGLPLVRAALGAGFPVAGFDIDPEKVTALNEGRSYIRHIPDAAIEAMRNTGRFSATDDFSAISSVEIILVCVPTPLDRHRTPDLSFVTGTAATLLPHLRPGQLFVLESTTYPGTTRDVLQPLFADAGVEPFLAYSPEREDPGNLDFSTTAIPKVVGGESDDALRLALTFYGQFVARTVPVSSSATAEAVKLTENIFRAVNIALVNELKVVFDAMGISIWEVIDAAKTKPFGYMPFYPGPGLGGHCIPIDPFYLTWKAREYGIATKFIELAGDVNTSMPRHVVDRLASALDQRSGRGLKGAKILIMGVAYKKNVGDIRETPAFPIMEMLKDRGAVLAYHDPHVPVITPTRQHPGFMGWRSEALEPGLLETLDAVLIVTDHDGIDYDALVRHVPVVVDTRNATRAITTHRDRIVLA